MSRYRQSYPVVDSFRFYLIFLFYSLKMMPLLKFNNPTRRKLLKILNNSRNLNSPKLSQKLKFRNLNFCYYLKVIGLCDLKRKRLLRFFNIFWFLNFSVDFKMELWHTYGRTFGTINEFFDCCDETSFDWTVV